MAADPSDAAGREATSTGRPRRGESSYQMISRELRSRVRRGEFVAGRQLPTEAELAQTYAVSRQTIRRAFQDLVAEDIVYRVPGRGTFAKATDGYVRQVGSVDDLMGLSDDTEMRVVEPLARRVDVIGAGRLRLPSDAVFQMRLVRMHDGVAFCATTVYLPPSLGRQLTDVEELVEPGAHSGLTVIGLVEGKLGVPIAEAQQSITVEMADQNTAAALSCEVEEPLLRIDRLYFDADGNAVELAISRFLTQHYSYRISLRRNA